MAQDKKRMPIEVSPEGVLAYAWLYKRDDKFAKGEDLGKFKASLIVDKAGPHAAWAEALSKIHLEDQDGTKKANPVKDGDGMKDKDGKQKEDFAGTWVVSMKSNYKPNVVDAKKRPVTGDVRAASGDLVKIAYQKNLYGEGLATSGLSMRMAAVQIIEKRAGEGLGAAAAAAFGEEEGYEAPEATGETGDNEAPPSGKGDF